MLPVQTWNSFAGSTMAWSQFLSFFQGKRQEPSHQDADPGSRLEEITRQELPDAGEHGTSNSLSSEFGKIAVPGEKSEYSQISNEKAVQPSIDESLEPTSAAAVLSVLSSSVEEMSIEPEPPQPRLSQALVFRSSSEEQLENRWAAIRYSARPLTSIEPQAGRVPEPMRHILSDELQAPKPESTELTSEEHGGISKATRISAFEKDEAADLVEIVEPGVTSVAAKEIIPEVAAEDVPPSQPHTQIPAEAIETANFPEVSDLTDTHAENTLIEAPLTEHAVTAAAHVPAAAQPAPNPVTENSAWAIADAATRTPATRFSMLRKVAQKWQNPLPQKRLFILAGTPSEGRRLAPVIRTTRARCIAASEPDDVCVCAAGEDPQLVREAIEPLGITVDCNVTVNGSGQSLDARRARVLDSFETIFGQIKPQWLVLTGDTLLSAMASLAAYHTGVHVARIDSGAVAADQPTGGPDPDTEEIHRQLVGLFSSVHFTETEWSKEALLREGIPESSVLVIGNTHVDALLESCQRLGLSLTASTRSSGTVRVLVTVGHGEVPNIDIREIARAIGNLAVLVPGLYQFTWPLPADPAAAEAVHQLLGRVPGIQLTLPASYDVYLRHLSDCDMVLTDSIDLQEEAPSLGKPVLMLGSVSRRVEAVRAGVVIPVSTDSASIQSAIRSLSRRLSSRHGQITNPYGDGKASLRIADFFEGRQVLEFGRTALPRLMATAAEAPQRLPEPVARWRLE